MKRILPLFLLLLSVLLLSCGGKDAPSSTTAPATTPGDSGPTQYTVVFRVGEEEHTQSAEAGTVPVYSGTVADYSDDAYDYHFTGWEPAPVEADENAVYTAVFSKTARIYDVTFRAGETTLGVVPTAYGELPVYTGTVSAPEGYSLFGWSNADKVAGDTVCDALFTRFSPETVRMAVGASSLGTAASRAQAVLCLALQEQDMPGSVTEPLLDYLRYSISRAGVPHFDLTPNFYFPHLAATVSLAKKTPSVWSRLSEGEVERLDLLMSALAVMSAIGTDDACTYRSGPGFVGNYSKGWNPNYPLSNVPQILFCVSYFGSADAVNGVLRDFDYDTYVAKFREWDWTAPLSRWVHTVDGFVDPDGDGRGTREVTTTEEDVAADTDGTLGLRLGEVRTVGYTTPKAMLSEGGEIFSLTALARIGQYVGISCGTGIGVPAIGEKGYSYHGYSLSDLTGLWNDLLRYNYSGGIVASKEVPVGNVYRCYIYDETISPVQGLNGLMREFRSGSRSSVAYCQHDFVLAAGITVSLRALDLYENTDDGLERMVWVGNTDFLYKAEHGYVSYTGTASRGDPVPVYGEGAGYQIWRSLWLSTDGARYALTDFDIPDPDAVPVEDTMLHYSKRFSASSALTAEVAKSANIVGDKNWWENDMILDFSFNFDDETSSFELRFRSSVRTDPGGRAGVLQYVAETGTLNPVSPLLSPIADAPMSIPLGDYGWHRITLRTHQDAAISGGAITYSVTLTVSLDGAEIGQYRADAAAFQSRGWLLYGAVADPEAEGGIRCTTSTPKPGSGTWVEGESVNNVFIQIYKGLFFNQEAGAWYLQYGDIDLVCGSAPARTVAPIDYRLDGGSFPQSTDLIVPDGYTKNYTATDVPYYAVAGRSIALKTPAREGYTFLGWYTNAECSGVSLTSVTTEAGEPITLYALWRTSEGAAD